MQLEGNFDDPDAGAGLAPARRPVAATTVGAGLAPALSVPVHSRPPATADPNHATLHSSSPSLSAVDSIPETVGAGLAPARSAPIVVTPVIQNPDLSEPIPSLEPA